MSQYQQQPQYQNPYGGNDVTPPRKTSGLAITALILSIIGLIPCIGTCTAPFGFLLGLITTVTTGGAKKGRGIAITAVLLGIIGLVIQVGVWRLGWTKFVVPVMEGPKHVLIAGFDGDLQGFRDASAAPMSNATDAEITAFIEALRARYGAIRDVKMDQGAQQGKQQPQMGQAEAPFPYIFEFQNATVNGESTIVFADQTTGEMVFKPGSIIILDATLGDLNFPPGGSATGNGAGNGNGSIIITPSKGANGNGNADGDLEIDPTDTDGDELGDDEDGG